MQRLLVVIALVIGGVTLAAQPPLTIAFEQPGETPETAQTIVYRVYLDALPPYILQGVICATVTGLTECQAPLPAPAIGVHTLYVTGQWASGEGGEGPKSPTITFRYPSVPGAPMNLRILKGSA